MSRHKHRTSFTWTTILALIAGVLAVLSTSPAQAEPSYNAWPKILDNVALGNNGTILTAPDGSFTVPSCELRTYSVVNMESFVSSTLIKYPKPTSGNQTISVCGPKDAAGIEGTIYADDDASSKIAAYKNGVKLWTTPLQPALGCSSSYWYDTEFTIGSDGNLYVLQENNSCSGPWVYLMGIDSQTGSVRFRSPVSTSNRVVSDGLYAYQDGLVARDGVGTVKYFDYSGNLQDTYVLPITTGDNVGRMAVDFDGAMSVSIQRERTNNSADLDCARDYPHSRILRRLVNSTVQDIRFTGPGSLGICFGVHHLKASPNGIVIAARNFAGSGYRLILINNSGLVASTAGIDNTGFGSNTYYNALTIDANGEILIERSVYTSIYNPQVQILRYGSAGVLLQTFSTSSITGNPNDTYRLAAWGYGDVHIIPGHILLALCKPDCNNQNPETLHKISFGGLAMDYPRSAIFGAIEVAQGVQQKYVALGDSFASVEGNPPFLTGTDVPRNRCHRSTNAYAMKLDQDASLDLNLQGFRACSGATTVTLSDGMNGENGQLDSLSLDTDIVTVSISGNDIGFGDGMTACTLTADPQVCEDTLSVINGNVHSPWFQQRVHNTYAAIKTAAPNARVFIVGYPLLMGMPGLPHCNWAARTMTSTEEALVDDIGTTLNSIINDEATDAGFAFLPLDGVFANHTPCSTTPYINGVDLVHNEYSYHPNAAGVQAIYEEIKAAL